MHFQLAPVAAWSEPRGQVLSVSKVRFSSFHIVIYASMLGAN